MQPRSIELRCRIPSPLDLCTDQDRPRIVRALPLPPGPWRAIVNSRFLRGLRRSCGQRSRCAIIPPFDNAPVHDLLRFGSLSWFCRSCPSNRALTGSQDQRERRVFGRSRSGWESRLRGVLQCSGGWYRTPRVVVPVNTSALAFVSC